MDRLGAAVADELSRFGPAAGMARIVEIWSTAVGPEIARNAWPARIGRDGTLYVSTNSSAWAFELAQLAADVLERLARALGEDGPPRLRFAPGPLPEPGDEPPEPAVAPRRAPTAAEASEARLVAAEIGDEEIREAVTDAIAASLAATADGRPF